MVTVIAALWLGSTVEARLMDAEPLTANSRVVLVRVLKAVLLVVAVRVALSSVGIDLTVLSVFGGALGVGLGLGLQRIARNYVSGFIILLDRSLSIGDMITVDKFYGRVAQINTRYTVIKALDGTETVAAERDARIDAGCQPFAQQSGSPGCREGFDRVFVRPRSR